MYLHPQGLYDPVNEHAACGVGFIATLNGTRSHDVVSKGLQILVNLTHRGASGCDPDTGDGAGILLQIPHELTKNAAADSGVKLPDLGEYGTGLVFLPRDAHQRRHIEQMLEDIVAEEGQQFLGWRDVPTNNEVIGRVACEAEPVIRQVFISRGSGMQESHTFERKLYIIRKRIEKAVRDSDLTEKIFFYIPSLSHRTLCYKGLLLATQIEAYYQDLADPSFVSGIALVHQRYSTNTFPTWDLAQPFRFLCHNGEINTLRGNINWMNARQMLFESPLFGDDIKKLLPVVTPGASDSAVLDNAIELLYHTGRSLPHAVMMLIPEAWQHHQTMTDSKKAFYEYHSCLMEPWDGPASIAFSDGNCIGAVLDRNGLRPSRYTVTKDGYVIMGSETGVIELDPSNVEYKGRLEPGRMLLVDTAQQRIVSDEEIKEGMAAKKPYRAWLDKNLVKLVDQPEPKGANGYHRDAKELNHLQWAFGYSREDLRILMSPMAGKGAEPIGSMGNDTPLAVLSERSPLLYNYFKQLFAQVTNPPLDAIREELVTSMITNIGAEQDLFDETELHCHQLRLEQPILTNKDLQKIKNLNKGNLRATTLPMLFEVDGKEQALHDAIEDLRRRASQAIADDYSILILSDRNVNRKMAAIPALLAGAAVHHHLIREGIRTRCGLIIESAEPREVHHFALLFAYGVGAVNPYLAFETLADLHRRGQLDGHFTWPQVEKNYVKAICKGVTKIMSKMGISTLHSYRGAQIFEAIGLNSDVVGNYFT